MPLHKTSEATRTSKHCRTPVSELPSPLLTLAIGVSKPRLLSLHHTVSRNGKIGESERQRRIRTLPASAYQRSPYSQVNLPIMQSCKESHRVTCTTVRRYHIQRLHEHKSLPKQSKLQMNNRTSAIAVAANVLPSHEQNTAHHKSFGQL